MRAASPLMGTLRPPYTINYAAGSTSTLTVQAKDGNGNNLTASAGTVTLSTSAGSLSGVTDNGNGTYTATLTSSATPGTANITGTIAGTAIAAADIRYGRSWFGRLLHCNADYVIRGKLSERAFAAPLMAAGQHLDGSLFRDNLPIRLKLRKP